MGQSGSFFFALCGNQQSWKPIDWKPVSHQVQERLSLEVRGNIHITALKTCPMFSEHRCCRMWEGKDACSETSFQTNSVNSTISPLLKATAFVKDCWFSLLTLRTYQVWFPSTLHNCHVMHRRPYLFKTENTSRLK